MPIIFDKNSNIFYLHTKNTTYIIELLNGKIPIHRYWGKSLGNILTLEQIGEKYSDGYCIDNNNNEIVGTTSNMTFEYPTFGTGDMREPAIEVEFMDGGIVIEPEYLSHKIYNGKPKIQGLPASYSVDDATTLELCLIDKVSNVNIVLFYTVFENYDIITRNTKVINNGQKPIKIKRISSACIDFFDCDYDIVHLPGQWARERHIEKNSLCHGTLRFDSKRGATGHCENPFVAFCDHDTNEKSGDVYAMNLVYSGSFEIINQLDSFNTLRSIIGINSFNFSFDVESGKSINSPEVILTYSCNGFGGMSRNFHKFYRERLIKGQYKESTSSILINNWEATYFNFNEEKILEIANKAKDIGIELFVLDDGWFGKRNNDKTSLGDWFCNKEKLPNGLCSLVEKINNLGLKFGIWLEPEMISPISQLFEKHPDWCIHIDGRKPHLGRNQLVLDLSRKEVCDFIIETVTDVLSSANISYVKWDMNRNITDMPSAKLSHEYMLGIYYVLETITNKFPNIIFEGCAGGGGRFDPAMLYYFPQIWCSDDTDAVERLYIQYGTSLVYPIKASGSHVSACPNHQVKRTTPLKMRGNVAMSGQFGYELDLSKLSDEETEILKEQVSFYKNHRQTIQFGDMYRLYSPFESNFAAWQFVSQDENEVIAFLFTIKGKPNSLHKMIKLSGLDNKANYKDIDRDIVYSGEYLMQCGIPLKQNTDNISKVIVLKKI